MSGMHNRRSMQCSMGLLVLAVSLSNGLGQTIKLDGTPTCFQVMRRMSKDYGKVHTGISFEVGFNASFAAVERLGKGDIDIAFIEYPLRKYVDNAWDKAFPPEKAPPVEYTFAQTALGIVVNKKNAVARLTHSQLRDIWSGKAASWRKVGGSGKTIKVLTSKALSGSMASDFILNYRRWSKRIKKLSADTDVIASVIADADAIGFVTLTPDLPKKVKLVAIAIDAKSRAISPTVDNIMLREYSLMRQYKLILTNESSPASRDFARFVCSQGASRLMQEYGLFPIATGDKAESINRLVQMKAGRGVRLSVTGVRIGKAPLQDLAIEYVRAKEVVRLSYASLGSDVAAVGAFVAGGTGKSELLVLDAKPGERAIEKHGWYWNWLAADGTGPVEHVLAGRAVAIIVNPVNKLESLTLGQVQAVFSGEVKDWAIVGSTGLASGGTSIQPFRLSPRDSAAKLFQTECMGKRKFTRLKRLKDTAAAVAAVGADPRAIAYADLAAIPTAGQTVKVLAIRIGQGEKAKDIHPTAKNIKNAMYPLSRRLHLYVHPKASDTAKRFATFLATCGDSSDTAKALTAAYRKHGLIPLVPQSQKKP